MKKCFTLETAKRIASSINQRQYGFIVAHETMDPDHPREFLVFNSLDSYLSMLYDGDIDHCHEVITSMNGNDKIKGRLVFDFDIPLQKSIVGNNFIPIIERYIISTFTKYYIDIDTSIMKFIWRETQHNTPKTSYHLVVKNAYFSSDWVSQMKQFYMLLSKELTYNKALEWINLPINKIIDEGLASKNHTLRMPLNSKRGGNKVLFVDSNTRYEDGLVCLYQKQDFDNEQTIVLSNCIYVEPKPQKTTVSTYIDIPYEELYSRFIEHTGDTTLGFDRCDGSTVCLKRLAPSKCYISGQIHESENPFISLFNNGIYFCCRRGCKTVDGKSAIYITHFKNTQPTVKAPVVQKQSTDTNTPKKRDYSRYALKPEQILNDIPSIRK